MRSAAWLAALAAAAALAALAACRREGPAATAPPNRAHPAVYSALPDRPVVRRLHVQLAYNLDDAVLYGHLSWAGEPERVDAFWRYEDGAWVLRGSDARSAIAAGTTIRSEARVAIAWSPESGLAALPNFPPYGCMLACHDDGTQQPGWAEQGALDAQTMRLPDTPFYANRGFDLWSWRAQTSGANGYWSDELLDDDQPATGPARKLDPGSGGAVENALLGGAPSFVFDPATTTGGGFATTLAAADAGVDFFFEDPADPSPVAGAATPKALPWADALAAGYVPAEGDVVPYFVLSARTGGRGDVLAALTPDGGTTLARRSAYDAGERRWHVYLSRRLATGAPASDVQMVTGGRYSAAFALHTDRTRGRDHAVALPLSVWLEDPNNPSGGIGADYAARQILGAGVVPDFDDTGFYAPLELELFLPGVVSWEFLTDTRNAAFLFGERHGGADVLQAALNGPGIAACRDCHVVGRDDPAAPFVPGGPLELRTPRRGGLFEATPMSLRANVLPMLAARCGGCHEEGGPAASMPLANAPEERILRELTSRGRVVWEDPAVSRLLRVPAENLDGLHPPSGSLAGYAGGPDPRILLRWLLYDAPDN